MGGVTGAITYTVDTLVKGEEFSVTDLLVSTGIGVGLGALTGGFGGVKGPAIKPTAQAKPSAAAKPSATAKPSSTTSKPSTTSETSTIKGGQKCSFTADTPVLLADGSTTLIAGITIGTHVSSTNPADHSTTTETVVGVWPHEDQIWELQLSDESLIRTTANHPWWVESQRSFIRTDQLSANDRLLGADGSLVTVISVTATQAVETTYNLTVTGPHTYHVGDASILVHNFNCGNATFIADTEGTVIPTSRARLEQGFQDAGFPTSPAESPGTIYHFPDGTSARVMEANGPNVVRVIFQDTGGHPVSPFTGKPPQPPRPKPQNWTQQYRDETHVELNP